MRTDYERKKGLAKKASALTTQKMVREDKNKLHREGMGKAKQQDLTMIQRISPEGAKNTTGKLRERRHLTLWGSEGKKIGMEKAEEPGGRYRSAKPGKRELLPLKRDRSGQTSEREDLGPGGKKQSALSGKKDREEKGLLIRQDLKNCNR